MPTCHHRATGRRTRRRFAWSRFGPRLATVWFVAALLPFAAGGCVYFNTFYHAKKFFNEGEKTRKSTGDRTAGISAGKNSYEKAIEKASKIVQKHPKSKYHDDALFLIGTSYFYINNYTKSEAAFRELLATHPKSNLVEESRLYLARCRVELGDDPAAFRAFTELAETAHKPAWRAEAIFQRGGYFLKNTFYDSAAIEYDRILNEYKDSERTLDARLRAAETRRHLGQYDSAIALYAPLIDDNIVLTRFQARAGTGEALYESDRPDSGNTIFRAMADDEKYADSIGTIRLLLARGLKAIGDDKGAWRQYEQITALLEKTLWSSEAYFRMAEIRQYRDKDLVDARDLYEKCRLESPNGPLSQQALTRSANITKLEQFRKELGRGELRGLTEEFAETKPYDPAQLPRLERTARHSPREARPPDYHLASAADSTATVYGPEAPMDSSLQLAEPAIPPDSSALVQGPPAPAQTPDSSRAQNNSPTTAEAEPFGPPISLATYYGPPVSQADIAYNERIGILLSDSDWQLLIGGKGALGPPSPAYLHEFGTGNLLGPPAPPDSVLNRVVLTAQVDSATLQMKAARDSARVTRQAELDKIKSSANAQLQLAELYRFDLGYPDSALGEYENMVERYPKTLFAAKALLGAADVLMDALADTVQAVAHLERILSEYPYSDYAGDAIARLHREGSPADTAHPLLAYRKAEEAMLGKHNPKRAIDQLEEFLNRYPDSRLVPNAEFAIASLRETYFPTEDSTVLLAYKEIQTKYPSTAFADAAAQKLTFTVKRPQKRVVPKIQDTTTTVGANPAVATTADTLEKKLAHMPKAPRPKFQGPFVYPESEIGRNWKGIVAFKILIGLDGQIVEKQLVRPSPSPEIDEAARIAVLQTYFFADSLALDTLNRFRTDWWYLYEIQVTPPATEQDQLQQLFPNQQNNP